MDRDFKGVWIDKRIWLDNKLSAIDKIILTEIDSLDNENHCTASNEYLSNFCQCSVSTITRSIKKLCELGYIEILDFNGKNRIIQSSLVKMTRQSSQNDEADSSNCTANNIYNNIYNINNSSNNINNNKELYEIFEENFGRTLAPIEFEKIVAWEKDINKELIEYALNIAVLNNKRNFRYIEGILRNWKTAGYEKIDDVKENENIKISKIDKNIIIDDDILNYDWFEEPDEEN